MIFITGGFVLFSCTNKAANLCVVARPFESKNELVITAFDPTGGLGKELVRIPLQAGSNADIGFDYWWEISPDGTQIAILKRHGHEIGLVPLGGSETKTIAIKGYSDLGDFYWATDSRSMFVSTKGAGRALLLHVGLNGDAQPIWQQPQITTLWGFPSPDGRHLAMLGASSEANVWLINNF